MARSAALRLRTRRRLTSAEAALLLGKGVHDDDLSYVLLEEATRSSSLEIAAAAANLLSERFAHEPSIADRYTKMHALLEQGLETDAQVIEPSTVESPELDGYSNMVRTLEEAGLPAPPVPDHLRRMVRRVGDWMWATTKISPTALYLRQVPDDSDEGFVFGHVGHGSNSYFLVYGWWSPTHAVVSRKAWGGAYSGNDAEPVVEFFQDIRGELASPPARTNNQRARARPQAGSDETRRRNLARRGITPAE